MNRNATYAQGDSLARRALSLATAPAIILVVILALGTTLRFWSLGAVRHSYDDGYPAYDALRVLDGHELVLIGQPSSVFLDNPPLMSYLQVLPLLVWRSPWGIYLLVVALNTTAIWFVYRAARQLLGTTAGLVAAFLFAINPWVVHFSRATWVQSLLPFFMGVIAWGLWPAFTTERGTRAGLLGAGLALVAMTQSYIQSWGVLVQLGPLLILSWRRIARPVFLVVLAILLLCLVAYGIGVASKWDANRAKLVRFSSPSGLHLTWEGLNHAIRLVSGRDYEDVYAQTGGAEYAVRRSFSLGAHYFLTLALGLGVARALLECFRRSQRARTALLLLVWFVVPILLTSASANPVHPHYLLVSCPAGHVLAAWGLSALLASKRARWVMFAVLSAIACLFAANLRQANINVAMRPTATETAFDDWALAAGAQVGSIIRELSSEEGYPRRICVNGREPLLSSLSATYLNTIQDLDFPRYVVLPGKEPLLYVLLNAPVEPGVLGPLQESFPERDLAFADGTRVSFVRVQPYSRKAALALPETVLDWQSETGLTLLGYTASGSVRLGEPIQCTTYWRVDELRPERYPWYICAFYHVLDKAGAKVVNVSGHGQWGSVWRLGDIHVERMSLPLPEGLPPGRYELEIGLFDPIHSANYSLLPPSGSLYALRIPVTVGEAD